MGSDREIKICHLASGDLWAGAEVQILTLLTRLHQEPSLRVSAVVLNQGELASRLRKSGIEVHIIDETEKGFFAILKDIEDLLRERGIDLLHSHRYKENSLAVMLKRRGIAPCIVQTVHGEGEPFKGLGRLRAAISTVINRYGTRNYFDRVITVSEAIRSRLVKKVNPDKVVAIHNSIDTSQLAPVRVAEEIKAELGIEVDRPVIGAAGRLVPVKGYDILLDAARMVCDLRPEVIFVLAGDGPLREELESRSRRLGLTDNFLFVGFRNDVTDLLNMFEILVMSSHNEGIPIVLLEAMGMAKPVVATAVGGMTEVVQNGLSGRLIRAGDAHALSEACLEILQDKKVGLEFGRKAKERICREFTVDIQCGHVVQLYRDVIGR